MNNGVRIIIMVSGTINPIGYPSGISAGYGYADGHLEINGVRVIDLKDQWGQSH